MPQPPKYGARAFNRALRYSGVYNKVPLECLDRAILIDQ